MRRGQAELAVVLPDGNEITAGLLESVASAQGSRMFTRFSYDRAYLEAPGAYNLSPDLTLSQGVQEPPVRREMFLAFEDAGPDRWGRELLQEFANLNARANGTPIRRSTAFETLLAVSDNTRQGAIRLYIDGRPVGADARVRQASQLDWQDLLRLVDLAQEGRAPEGAIANLVQMGSASPGGSRPKVDVRTGSGSLNLAKLPQAADRWDVGLWEEVALQLADKSGIRVPRHRLHRIDPKRSILLIERFDRQGDQRVGYISARSLLQIEDHAPDRGDYVRLSRELLRHGGREDQAELFRRVAFSVLVTNTDDHMRNHGLLRHRRGWSLSPVFDVNPDRLVSAPSTPLSKADGFGGRELRRLFELRDDFSLTEMEAKQILIEVEVGTRAWAEIARGLGESAESVEAFARAFEGPSREWVRSLA